MPAKDPGRRSWLVIVVAVLALNACVERDRSEGTFDLHASGGLEVDYRGPARAVMQWGIYLIELDLKPAGSPLRSEDALRFVFTVKPDSGLWPSTLPSVADRHGFRIDFGGAQGVVMRWQPDSGRIHITTPARTSGVAGSFVVFAHCDKCGPNESLVGTVLTGTFATHR